MSQVLRRQKPCHSFYVGPGARPYLQKTKMNMGAFHSSSAALFSLWCRNFTNLHLMTRHSLSSELFMMVCSGGWLTDELHAYSEIIEAVLPGGWGPTVSEHTLCLARKFCQSPWAERLRKKSVYLGKWPLCCAKHSHAILGISPGHWITNGYKPTSSVHVWQWLLYSVAENIDGY